MMKIVIALDAEIFVPVTYRDIKRGRYMVSNYGNIKDLKTDTLKNIRRDYKGYCWCDFQLETSGKRAMSVYRIVGWAYCPGYCEETGRTIVNHEDTNKENNYYENLSWVTISENNSHSYWYGNGKVPNIRGEASNLSIYSEEKVKEICKLLESLDTPMEVLNYYGFKRRVDNDPLYSLTYSIKNKKAWAHISKEYSIL